MQNTIRTVTLLVSAGELTEMVDICGMDTGFYCLHAVVKIDRQAISRLCQIRSKDAESGLLSNGRPFYANLTIDIVLLIVIHISGVCQPDS
jgi:hypothetical protein